jgi:predicted dienelactone hydrolase
MSKLKPCICLHIVAALVGLVSRTSASSAEPLYDPLKLEANDLPEPVELVVNDDSRSREIPILVYLPKGTSPAPVVLFSHGLGGARTELVHGQALGRAGLRCRFSPAPGQ